MKSYTKWQNAALLFLRLVTAAIFLYAGIMKWYMPTEGMTAGMVNLMKLLAVVEPLGGLGLIVGFLTRWAAAGCAIIMVGAIVIMQFMMQMGFATAAGAGWNFPLAILAGCIALIAFGGGKWSLDRVWRKD